MPDEIDWPDEADEAIFDRIHDKPRGVLIIILVVRLQCDPARSPAPVTDQQARRTFLNSCRVGQTERGSFVATILAPVPPEIQPSLAGLDAGRFDRNRRFPPGDDPADVQPGAGLAGDPDRQGRTPPGRGPAGIRANLCDALVMMSRRATSRASTFASPGPGRRPHLPAEVPQSVSFPQEHFAVIEEVGGSSARGRPHDPNVIRDESSA